MTDRLNWLNQLPREEAEREFFKCCGCQAWALLMTDSRPFATRETLFHHAQRNWELLPSHQKQEIFAHHPRIGDIASLEKRFASTAQWSKQEQAGMEKAELSVLQALAKANRDYEARFGYIFLVCASGKSPQEMLKILQARLTNEADVEFNVAMLEQGKITKLRLEKLLAV